MKTASRHSPLLATVTLGVTLVLTVAAGFAAQAQSVRTPTAPVPMLEGQAEMMNLQMAMVAAQQAAIRRGDEALPCEALQKELVSTMNDPAIQAYAAKTSAVYAKELEPQQGPMTAGHAAALAAALGAGMGGVGMAGMPQVVPGQALTPQQMQQAMVAQQRAAIASMKQLMPIMPALMRSQHVSMLAAMKNCAWLTGGMGLLPGLSPGTVPAAIPTMPRPVPKR